MLDRLRYEIRNLNNVVWFALIGVVFCVLIGFAMTRQESGLTVEEYQGTVDVVSTADYIAPPTYVAHLTQTPPSANLTRVAPTISIIGKHALHQYAAAAEATSEFDVFERGAVQVTGPPNTEVCQESISAWSTRKPADKARLTVYFAQPATPLSITIYQTFNPGFITQVTFFDLYGESYVVYEAAPGAQTRCPYILEIDVKGVAKPGTRIIITLDQTANTGGGSQIDAVEFVGIKH